MSPSPRFPPLPIAQEDHFDTGNHYHHDVLRDSITGKVFVLEGKDMATIAPLRGQRVRWTVQDSPLTARGSSASQRGDKDGAHPFSYVEYACTIHACVCVCAGPAHNGCALPE